MSEPIRILHVFAKMNRGGAETMIMTLYRHIDRAKIQFDFIVHTEKKCAFDDEINQLGGKVFQVPRYNGKNHIKYIKAWKKFFVNHPEYRLIHGHVRSTAAIYLKEAKKYGLTTIAHSHNTSSGKGLSALVKNIFQYPIRYTADYLFACSLPAGKWLFGEKALTNQKFKIVKNAIETKKFMFNEVTRNSKREDFKLDEKFVIGHVGRFHPQKNHDFLIDVFKEIHDRHRNAVLLLVGDGELRKSINDKVDKLGLTENVVFTGVRNDVPDLFQAMDVFVFPSKYEGLGIVVVEAQASGLPCIIADTIPREAIITNNVITKSLKEGKVSWAESTAKHSGDYKRKNLSDLIIKSGYDIKSTTIYLEEFYIKNG